MKGVIRKFLGFPKEINGWDHRRLTHQSRWTIFTNKRFQVFLDHCDVQDWHANLHNYPERFISLGLVQSGTNGPQACDRAAWMLLFGRSSSGTKS